MARASMTNTSLGNELGATGLKQSSGYIMDDFERELQGRRGMERYREMSLSHPIVAAAIWGYRQMLVKPRIWVEPASDQKQDVDAAEFVEQCLDDMRHTMRTFRNEVVSYLTYGFSWFEIVYKRRLGQQKERFTTLPGQAFSTRKGPPDSKYDDGKVGWDKFAPRAQEAVDHWQFDDTGELAGMWHAPAPLYTQNWQPLDKCLHFVTAQMRSNPEGLPLARSSFRQYRNSMRVEDAEAIAVARNMHGFPLLQPPDGLDLFNAEDPDMVGMLEDAKRLVTSVKTDAQMGAVIPFGWVLTLLNAGPASIDTNSIIDRYHTRIALAVGSQFMMLGIGRGGAYELAKQQQSLWLRAVQGYLEGDVEVLNRTAIPALCDLNDFGGKLTEYPKLKVEDVTEMEIAAIADAMTKLTQQGLFTPSPKTEEFLREKLGAPELEEEFVDDTPPDEKAAQMALQFGGGGTGGPAVPGKNGSANVSTATNEEAAAGAGGKGAVPAKGQQPITKHYTLLDIIHKAHEHDTRQAIEHELEHPEEAA
jgi:hypothetical protein